MINIRSICICFIVLSSFFVSASRANELASLKYVTELYPPYNFKSDGQLQGIAVDILLDASKDSGSPISKADIHVLPWSRAYQSAVKGPNVVLFSTTRTSHREPLFQWVGPITNTRVVLLARKSSNIKIASIGDVKQHQVGVIRDDIGEQMALARGVSPQRLKRIGKASSLAKMLAKGRIDLWAYEENAANWFLRNNGFDNDDFESVFVLNDSQLFYTFSKDVAPELLSELQQGIDKLKSEKNERGISRYDEILNKYL